jgi:hypothetical protein
MKDIVSKLRSTEYDDNDVCKAADIIELQTNLITELITNCNSCEYKALKPPTDSGWCYMFKTKPDGICMQHSLNKFIYGYNKKVD